MALIVVGINHRTAPVENREQLAFADASLPGELQRIRQLGIADEVVILSTCNRVEIYVSSTRPADELSELLREFMLKRAGLQSNLTDKFYTLTEPESLKHLFRVAAGMDSMVVGETEVFGQVKRAYETALRQKCTGRVLNRAFQRAFNVAKQIRSQTNIQRGTVSVASVAVDLAQRIFNSLAGKTALVIGAGDTGEKAARALLSRGVGHLIVTNRSYDRALALATDLGGQAIPYADWERALIKSDIVISSTSAPSYLVNRSTVDKLMPERKYRPLLIIDVGVPRNVDPAVALAEGVFLYNIDDLQEIAAEALKQRQNEIARCEALILEKLRESTSPPQDQIRAQQVDWNECFDP